MATTKQMTLAEFLELAEQEPPLEFFQGRVTQKVSPQGKHSALEPDFAAMLNAFARPRRLGRAFTELRSTHSNASLIPDISFYRRDRVPRDPDGRVGDVFVTAPDIAVEILSPGQSRRDLIDKCHWFVANGSAISLLVNPRNESVMHFRSGEVPVTMNGQDRIDLDAVLPGFELTVSALFATLLD